MGYRPWGHRESETAVAVGYYGTGSILDLGWGLNPSVVWVCVASGSQGAGIEEVWARDLVWLWYLFSVNIDRAPTVCQPWAVAGNTEGIWASPLRELTVWLSDLACTSTNVFLCHTSQDREAFRGSEEEGQVFPNWSYDQEAFMEEVTLLLRLKTRVHQTFRADRSAWERERNDQRQTCILYLRTQEGPGPPLSPYIPVASPPYFALRHMLSCIKPTCDCLLGIHVWRDRHSHVYIHSHMIV